MAGLGTAALAAFIAAGVMTPDEADRVHARLIFEETAHYPSFFYERLMATLEAVRAEEETC